MAEAQESTATDVAPSVAQAGEGSGGGEAAPENQNTGPSLAAQFGQFFGSLRGSNPKDTVLPVLVIAVVLAMVLPMPTWLLDFSLALSVTISVLILMTVMSIQKPLELSSFPTILLIATMLRLSLNIASTRMILTNGHLGEDAAGKVIEAFGGFVMGNNYVIGVIVFAILVIINFIVITKGSGRIAEVAARFTLDAMPGKQMAIDADLSAGLISEDDARTRRKELEQESSFFGAMDGAAKFVRGDAVAGILITLINVVGGMIIGMAQNDMSFGDAVAAYTTLTVGDGLVSQIPALLVSVGAGLMVSKAGVEGGAGTAVIGQITKYPKALALSSGLMAMIAFMPGIPFVPFFGLAVVTGGLAYYMPKMAAREVAEKLAQERAQTEKAPVADQPISASLAMDTLRLELGYGLLPMVNQGEKNRLTDQIKALRRQIAGDMGFILPSVRIQDNLQLDPQSYRLMVKEIEAAKGDVRPGMLLCMDPKGEPITLPGERTKEPTFGLPAMWVDPKHREEAHFRGLTVVDAQTVLTTHLTEIVKDYMPELLSYAETQKLLDEVDAGTQKLVADTVPTIISVTGFQRIMQTLLAERVSIRDLPSILEGVAESGATTKSLTQITEHVRMRLSRQLCNQHADGNGTVSILTLSPDYEETFANALVGDGDDKQLAMPPTDLQRFMRQLSGAFEDAAKHGENPVLLTSPMIRPYVRSLVERFRPQTVVMSQAEIHPKARIKTVGVI